MKKNKVDLNREQSVQNLNEDSIQNNPDSMPEKLSINADYADEIPTGKTFQRKPQFRINENSKKRFF